MKQYLINMKGNIIFLMTCLLFMVLALLALNPIHAQTTSINPIDIIDDVKKVTDWSELLSLEAAIYTFLITVGGWLSSFIPGLRSIDSGTYRVLVWAIMVITGSLVIGVGDVWVGAISYFFSTSLYEIVIKWIRPSPKPNEVN